MKYSRRDDQINQAIQMYVLLLRNKQLFFPLYINCTRASDSES